MNSSLEILFIFFTIFIRKVFTFPSPTIPYSLHCNSFAHEATPTDKMFTRFPFLEPVTSHYTGGQNILDQDSQSQRSIVFEATENIFKTNVADTYKIQARLSFFSSNIYHRPSNFTYSRSNYSLVGWQYRRPLVFNLDGFWSVSTDKLCMVGSATWFSKKGDHLKLDAVLKLRFSRFITLNNSLVSGILESINFPHDSSYFDTISMLGFPRVAPFKYKYTLVSNLQCNGVVAKSLQDSVTSMQSVQVCSLFTQRFMTYKLEYPSNCMNCSLFGEGISYLPSFVSLYAIQCSFHDKKLRFLVEFQDRRFTPYDQSFNPEISLIGEGTWNGTKDELCIVACHILNHSDPLGSARVGDCSIRLTLWFPAFRSIKKTHTTEGQIWTTKITDDMGSFRTVSFQSFDHSTENHGWKYEYTQMEKVRRICPKQKAVGKKYRLGYYGFDISVKHKNMHSTGSVLPMFMGNRAYNYHSVVNPTVLAELPHTAPDISTTSSSGRQNISFEISFILNISSISRNGISSLNLSANNGRVDISAEGLYDDETGQICMVGCRNLISENTSLDCEILVKLQLPDGNGSFIKGSIESLREKKDVFYFGNLNIFSLSYTEDEARKTVWRMDLEIIMVLLSNTLSCVFIGCQLFHLKKTPEMVTFLSVLMMMILTLGYMVPLVLNFEAVFTNTHNQQNIGLLEANEVIVRIVTMVAFILQFRLFQLTWAAKTNRWVHEIRTLLLCLSIYIFGGSLMLLMNWKNNSYTIGTQSQQSIWGDLRSYAGLTLDGFLFPQIILNIFQVSKGNALTYSFYIGTTFIRLLPHGYDLYRGPKFISHQFDRLYIYANPRADFYSPSWDIVIACGGIVFAVIILLQQLFGGRFFFPKRSQESVEYEMVPVASNE